MIDQIPITAGTPRVAPTPEYGADRPDLRHSAEAFETAFLAEMLKHSGIGAASDGDEQGDSPFASFMADAYAEALMRRGGTGLAARIEQALAQRLQGETT